MIASVATSPPAGYYNETLKVENLDCFSITVNEDRTAQTFSLNIDNQCSDDLRIVPLRCPKCIKSVFKAQTKGRYEIEKGAPEERTKTIEKSYLLKWENAARSGEISLSVAWHPMR